MSLKRTTDGGLGGYGGSASNYVVSRVEVDCYQKMV